MALINITEFSELARDVTGQYVSIGVYNSNTVVDDVTGITATSQQSSAFATTTGFVQLNPDIDVRVAVGENPTAAATGTRIPAGAIIMLGVPRGGAHKLAVRTA